MSSPSVTAAQAFQLFHAGRRREAERAFREVVKRTPRDAASLHALAVLVAERGRHEEALRLLASAAEAAPRDAALLITRGSIERAAGRGAAAVASFRRAAELDPGSAVAWYNLGVGLGEAGDRAGAIEAERRAVALDPGLASAHYNLACDLQKDGRFAEAIAGFATAVELEPRLAVARLNLGQALLACGRVEEGVVALEQARAGAPGDPGMESALVFALHYDPRPTPEALFAAARAWAERHEAPRRARQAPHRNRPDPDRRLRIGYVSPDFSRHPVGYFLLAALRHRDRDRFQAVCYSQRTEEDDMTALLRAEADLWRRTSGVGDDTLAERVREDGIDILVDLAGHTANNRLPVFAMKPAPVQASWLGYIDTTGLSSIDYLITDRHETPPGEERFFSETAWRLPHGSMGYTPPDYAPHPAPPPSVASGRVTFGCFNNLAKLNPAVASLWARVLEAVPASVLLLKSKPLGDPEVAGQIGRLFAEAGVPPERLELRGFSPHPAMLAEYGDVDIALDPFPYSGGLTSCEALWMGVPVVTLGGDRLVSRQTVSFLHNIGRPELVARSADDYVALAAALAGDGERLTALRAALRPQMAASPLCDGKLFAQDLEAAWRAMWRRWCEGRK